MGKIVKYCSVCEESFAEKFGFCPICGESLTAFEMNPVKNADKVEEKISDSVAASDEIKTKVSDNSETDQLEIPKTPSFLADNVKTTEKEVELDLADEDETEELEPIARPKFSVAGADSGFGGDVSDEAFQTKIDYSNQSPIDSKPAVSRGFSADDDGFHITVLTEKNVKERNLLLLGTMVLMLSLAVGVVIASLFSHDLGVGAIGDDDLVAFVPVVDEVPMTVEEEVQQKKNDKNAGGGGGGGGEEKTPTSKGRLATQTDNPLIAPTKTIVQKDFELKSPIASTKGTKEAKQTEEPYGDPNSLLSKLSDGLGKNRGQGSGDGGGQGSGRNSGQGSGINGGSGGGRNGGNGDGDGPGNQDSRDTPPKVEAPKVPAGPSTGVKFLSKPQPKYTDAARQNNVQGLVTLRITFLANGQIGSISPVSGLSNGLTEQAIAAARQIRFEPAMRNGQPYSVTKSVQYTFTIY